MATSDEKSSVLHSFQKVLKYANLEPLYLLEPLTRASIEVTQETHHSQEKLECVSTLLTVVENLERQPPVSPREYDSQDVEGCANQRMPSQLQNIVTGVCIPNLKSVRPDESNLKVAEVELQLLHSVCALTMSCLRRSEDMHSLRDIIIMMGIKSVQAYCETVKLSDHDRDRNTELDDTLHIYTALELLNYFFESKNSEADWLKIQRVWTEKLFTEMLHVLRLSRDRTVCTRIVSVLLPRLLDHNPELLSERLELLWKQIATSSVANTNHHGNVFLLLCGLADYYFPSSGQSSADILDLKRNTIFWDVVQLGIIDSDALNRKRAMYLLKRVVDLCSHGDIDVMSDCSEGDWPKFWWSSKDKGQLKNKWQDFILLVETLEETQMHVFKPLMPRLSNLIQATYNRSAGFAYMHSSWLAVLFERTFKHDSKNTVVKWALLEFLTLDFTLCPLLKQGNSKFLHGAVMKTMNESTLYARIQSTDQTDGRGTLSSPVGHAVIGYFKSCVNALDTDIDKVDFINGLLVAMANLGGWGMVPMIYTSQALANIPTCKAWNWTSLKIVREMLTLGYKTLPNHLRGALSYYLVEGVLNLMNTSQVTLQQFAVIIGTLETLQRGSLMWVKLQNWLKANGHEFHRSSDSLSLSQTLHNDVVNCLSEKENDNYGGSIDVGYLATVILLCSDAHFSMDSPEKGVLDGSPDDYPTPLHMILQPMHSILCKLNSHAYLCSVKAHHTLQLLLALLREIHGSKQQTETFTDQSVMVIVNIIETSLEETLAYIMRKITMETNNLTDVIQLNVYVEIIDVLSELSQCGVFGEHTMYTLQRTLDKMSQISLDTLNTETTQDKSSECQIPKIIGMNCLYCVCSHYGRLRDKGGDIPSNITKNLTDIRLNQRFERPVGDMEVSKQDLGKLISLFEEKKWNCVFFLEHNYGSSWSVERCVALLGEALDVLSIVGGTAVLPLIDSMNMLIKRVINVQPSVCVECMNVTWSMVYDIRADSALFWQVIEKYTDMAFQDCILSSPPMTDIYKAVTDISRNIFELAEIKSGVLHILIEKYCEYLLSTTTDTTKDILNHVELLVEACIFGPIQRKDHRVIQEALSILTKNSDGKPASEMLQSMRKPDNHVRVLAITTLSLLIQRQPSNLPLLVKKLADSLLDKSVAVTAMRKQYQLNSMQHRIKQRIWQTMLILQPAFDQDASEYMLTEAMKSLQTDSQLSIKNLIEWFIALTLYKYPQFLHLIWDMFNNESQRKTVGVMTSLISIITILGPVIKCKQHQDSYLGQVITTMMSYTMAGNFTIRLYAQSALQKIWTYCDHMKLTHILDRYPGIKTCVNFLESSSHAGKLKERLLGNYLFFKFDPIQDYSIETIFHSLPYLCNVIDNELISPESFQSVVSGRQLSLPLFNARNELKTSQPGTWKIRGPMDYTITTGDTVDDDLMSGDVQKKITPWSETLLDEDVSSASNLRNRKRGQLILVTSLIDKLPNLGGICRTCEIFGVGQLVLASLKYAEHKDFQGLSVTAEKWIPLREVKASALKDYLLEVRKEGYTLIGVEQTANSHCLTQYQFTDKTLLLLGNEREGIPVELIQLLDMCVEIPQLGVIRSLNVHVSGALLVWEYTRQQLLKAT